MADLNPLAALNAAELAALAKAQAAGVTLVGKDGTTTNVSETTPPAAAAAAAAAAASAAADPKAVKPVAGEKPARPDDVPEKFWDAEKGVVNTAALLKSYGELEKTRSKPVTESTETKPAAMGDEPATPAVAPKPGDAPAKTAEQVAAEQTVARDTAIQQANSDIQKDGKLADATYTALEKVGYSRAVVDEFVAGQKAQAQLAVQAIHSVAGGKAEFDKMVAWGKANYTDSERTAFDKAIRSGDQATAALAVGGLKARFAADFGSTGARIEGGNGAPTGNAFRSQAELVKAMNDVRYKTNDTAFHREVAERIQASARQNIDIGIRIQH